MKQITIYILILIIGCSLTECKPSQSEWIQYVNYYTNSSSSFNFKKKKFKYYDPYFWGIIDTQGTFEMLEDSVAILYPDNLAFIEWDKGYTISRKLRPDCNADTTIISLDLSDEDAKNFTPVIIAQENGNKRVYTLSEEKTFKIPAACENLSLVFYFMNFPELTLPTHMSYTFTPSFDLDKKYNHVDISFNGKLNDSIFRQLHLGNPIIQFRNDKVHWGKFEQKKYMPQTK